MVSKKGREILKFSFFFFPFLFGSELRSDRKRNRKNGPKKISSHCSWNFAGNIYKTSWVQHFSTSTISHLKCKYFHLLISLHFPYKNKQFPFLFLPIPLPGLFCFHVLFCLIIQTEDTNQTTMLGKMTEILNSTMHHKVKWFPLKGPSASHLIIIVLHNIQQITSSPKGGVDKS